MLKRCWLFFLVMPLATSVQAIEITDYTDPDIFYEDAKAGATLSFQDGNQDQISFNGQLFGEYEMVYSTKPFVWRANLAANILLNRGSNEGDSTDKDYFVGGLTVFDKYLTDDIYGLFGFGEAEVDYLRLSGVDDDEYFVDVTGGVGYGRITEATPLAGALRIVEELRKYGVLLKEPTNDTYLELAAIVNREDEFEDKYGKEDYRQYWIEELSRVMQREGLLKDNVLGVTGTIQLYDVLTNELRGAEQIGDPGPGNTVDLSEMRGTHPSLLEELRAGVQRRAHGWLARAGIGYSFHDEISFGSDNDPLLKGSFQYELPMGLAMQLTDRVSYAALLSDDPTHRIQNNLKVTHEITDRIDWINEWELRMDFPTADGAEDYYRNWLGSRFYYRLTNVMDAIAGIQLISTEDNVDDNGNDDMETFLFMGIGYELR